MYLQDKFLRENKQSKWYVEEKLNRKSTINENGVLKDFIYKREKKLKFISLVILKKIIDNELLKKIKTNQKLI